jgi:small subunit ribosomal protein S6
MPSNGFIRQYNLTYLLPGTMTQHQADELKVKVESLVQKHGGSLIRHDEWGKKTLAYTITHENKKQKDGYYYHLVFSLNSLSVPLFEKDVYLTAEIMRHLVVLHDEEAEAAKQQETVKGE